jgi:hypothetical protein
MTYIMKNSTLLSAEGDAPKYPETQRFFAPEETPLPAHHPGLIDAKWSWHEISQKEWHQLPERLRLLRTELAKRAPVSFPGDYRSDNPADSRQIKFCGPLGQVGSTAKRVPGDSPTQLEPFAVTLIINGAYATKRQRPRPTVTPKQPRQNASEDRRLGPTMPPGSTVAPLLRGGADKLTERRRGNRYWPSAACFEPTQSHYQQPRATTRTAITHIMARNEP